MGESKRGPKHDSVESRRDTSIHNSAYKIGDVKGRPIKTNTSGTSEKAMLKAFRDLERLTGWTPPPPKKKEKG